MEFLALASAPLNMQSLFVINFRPSPAPGGDASLLPGESPSWCRPGLTLPSPPPPPPLTLLSEVDVEVAVAYRGEAEVAVDEETEDPRAMPRP